MASFFTNRGVYNLLEQRYRAAAAPTNLYVALVTAGTTPTVDTNTLGELTEIAAGNGYTSGGVQLTPGATDFDVSTEDDAADRAFVQVKDIVFTASGGNLPASGAGARYAVVTTDEATVANRQVEFVLDLGSDRVVSDTQSITLVDGEAALSTV